MSGAIKGIFGGGGGGGMGAQLMQFMQAQQEQAAIRDAQGRQMAALSKTQADADNELATLRRPGLGRAMLSYRGGGGGSGASTLGGA